MPLAKASKIFLSATKSDCDDYRQSLKAEVEARSKDVKVHLQEHWGHPAVKVVDLCKAKLEEQDAYIGLFGHRHGWQPPGFAESITQLEFQWATERWNARQPPVFILLPELGSRADVALRRAAGRALRREFGADKAARKASWARQKQFIADVKRWAHDRFLLFYRDQRDLLLSGTHAVKDWNLEVLDRAGTGRRGAGAGLSEAELGRIGRQPQLDALKAVLGRLLRRRDAPAVAFAVHGAESHGQLAFAHLLTEWEHWDDWDEIDLRGPLPLDKPLDATSLARWVASCNQTPLDAAADPLAALAGRLAERLRSTDLVFVLSAIGNAPERWTRLARDFWQPLVAALVARQQGEVAHRLMLFVVDHEPAPVGDATLFWPGRFDAPDLDATRLVALPELTAFRADDVQAWLDDLASRGCRVPRAERPALAAGATTPDGTPNKVFDRLKRQGFYRIG